MVAPIKFTDAMHEHMYYNLSLKDSEGRTNVDKDE